MNANARGSGMASGLGGGTLATAGNLAFQDAVAYNAQTGERLWQADLGGANVTPVTYMLDDKQYVSLLAGAPVGSRSYTFVLDGKEPLPAPLKTSTTTPATTTPSETPEAAGRNLVVRICTTCHVMDVVTDTKMTRESWKRTVDNMVERGARGTPQELNAIVDYLSKNFGAE